MGYNYRTQRNEEERHKKILSYYDKFINNELNITEIDKLCRVTSGVSYPVLEEEFKRRKKLKKIITKDNYIKRENIEKLSKIDIGVDEIYNELPIPEPTIITPIRVIEREDDKVEVIYESKLNKNE